MDNIIIIRVVVIVLIFVYIVLVNSVLKREVLFLVYRL